MSKKREPRRFDHYKTLFSFLSIDGKHLYHIDRTPDPEVVTLVRECPTNTENCADYMAMKKGDIALLFSEYMMYYNKEYRFDT